MPADARVLDDLAAIPREQLPPAEQLSYDLFRHDYEMRKAAAPFHREYYAVEASGGPQSLNEVADVMPFETVQDYDTWLRRMTGAPGLLDQFGDLLIAARRQEAHAAAIIMERVLRAARSAGARQAGRQPVLPISFRSYPDSIPAADRMRLTRRKRRA